VVPLSYFIERPFQNWTRVSADLPGTVYIYADYTGPVDEMRQELLAVLKDSGTAWNLRCYVREKLVVWLQERYPMSLPRVRAELNGDAPR
jgi:hypothetical protein